MKRKNKLPIMTTVFIGSLFIGLVVVEGSTNHVPTKGEIHFIPSSESTPPVNPLDPDINAPIDVDEDQIVGTTGPLTIDFVSNLHFGKQKITSRDETYYARPQGYRTSTGDKVLGPNFIQITDNRGTEAGWTLYLKQNGQFKTEDGEELIGATVGFKHGEVIRVSDSPAPQGLSEVELSPNGEQVRMLNALPKTGAGTNQLSWGSDTTQATESIYLKVPGKTIKYSKHYSTTFTWTLSDVPSN